MPILLTRMFAFRRTHKGADIAHSNDFKVFFATSIKSDARPKFRAEIEISAQCQ
jgi:hypothetical protein